MAQAPPSLDYADYVEAARPRLAPRPLSADEQKAAAAAVRRWGSKKTEADLAAVRPFAEAGDVASLQAMMNGYVHLRAKPSGRGGSAALPYPDRALTALGALWATAYWRQAGGSLEAVKALAPCMTNNVEAPIERYDYHKTIATISSKGEDFDCGFDAKATPASFMTFKWARDKNKEPAAYLPINFVERPLTSQADLDAKRLNDVLARVENQYTLQVSEQDHAWLRAQRARDPAIDARAKEAFFESEMRRIEAGGPDLLYNDSLRQYIQADPQRVKRYEAALKAQRSYAFNNSSRVSSMLASPTPATRETSSWLAIQSASTARQWWTAYGGNLSGNVPGLPQWCTAGIQEACDMQKAADTAAKFREKYGDPASIGAGTFAGPSGSIDQSQFAKERAAGAARCEKSNVAGVQCK